jgi:hypothetical protein
MYTTRLTRTCQVRPERGATSVAGPLPLWNRSAGLPSFCSSRHTTPRATAWPLLCRINRCPYRLLPRTTVFIDAYNGTVTRITATANGSLYTSEVRNPTWMMPKETLIASGSSRVRLLLCPAVRLGPITMSSGSSSDGPCAPSRLCASQVIQDVSTCNPLQLSYVISYNASRGFVNLTSTTLAVARAAAAKDAPGAAAGGGILSDTRRDGARAAAADGSSAGGGGMESPEDQAASQARLQQKAAAAAAARLQAAQASQPGASPGPSPAATALPSPAALQPEAAPGGGSPGPAAASAGAPAVPSPAPAGLSAAAMAGVAAGAALGGLAAVSAGVLLLRRWRAEQAQGSRVAPA